MIEVLVALLLPLTADADRVVIYDGPGACPGCAGLLADQVRRMGHEPVIATPAQIDADLLKSASAYIQPGGDNTMNVRNALGTKRLNAIRDFVRGGGRYVGICLGATLASTGLDEDDAPYLGLLPVESVETGDTTARLQTVDLSPVGGGRRKAFVQDPPAFKTNQPRAVQILARYEDGGAAAVQGRYHAGQVLLLGPHFEASPDWFTHHRLNDSDGPEQSQFRDLLRRILPKPASRPRAPPEASR